MSSLRKKVTSGLFWSTVERVSQQGCVFLVQVILARLLEPAQFGLIAMVSVFVIISSAVIESGLGNALVQKQDANDTDRSTVFWFNLFAAVAMVVILWLFAPQVAEFYGQPELSDVLRVLGLSLVIGAVGNVHSSLLRRTLQFRKLFWVSTPSTLISGGIGIALALQGFGVWALVGQALSQSTIRTLSLWLQSGWRPQLVFDWSSMRKLLPFGARLAASSILDRGFQNLYVLVIGKVFTPVDVGYFQRAFAFQQLPARNLNEVIGGIAFPVLSALQHEPARLRRVLSKSLHLTALLSFSGMAVLAAIARPLITVLLGEKWLPCVPMLQLLCVAGALYPLHAGNLSLLKALGRADLFLRLEVIKKILTLANILVTWRFGIQVMICGMVVTSLIGFGINTYYTRKFIDFGMGRQLRHILPMIILAFVLAGSLFGLLQLLPVTEAAQLALSALWAAGMFLVALRLMPRAVQYEIGVALAQSGTGRNLSLLLLGKPVSTNSSVSA